MKGKNYSCNNKADKRNKNVLILHLNKKKLIGDIYNNLYLHHAISLRICRELHPTC
jgi:hypothetical protein